MEAIVLAGLQGSGKSSFYADRFFATHVRISRDLLRTPQREARFLELCLESRQKLVVDKVNATRADRRPYDEAARTAGFRPVARRLDVAPRDAIARNAHRPPDWRVPAHATLSTHKRLEPPALEQGFDEVWRVWPAAGGGFGTSLLAGGRAPARDDAGPGPVDTPPRWSRGVAARR